MPARLIDLPACPLPPGAVVAVLAVGPARVRVARWVPAEAPRGTVVICPGRSEFIEKYAEVVGELLGRGFAVAVFDWRGQGGSSRHLADPLRGHILTFDDYRADLDAVLEGVVRPHCPRPFYALAHSMGGAITLDHASVTPPVFERIVLSAPMLGIFGLRMPHGARRLARLVTLLGGGGAYVPHRAAHSWVGRGFEGNGLTSDPRRYALLAAYAEAAPDLMLGAPTFGWLAAALRVMTRLDDPAVLRRITTPVLAVACGADPVVRTAATERVVSRLPHGRTVVVPHALHEILMEADPLRALFWAAFDAFVPGSGGAALRSAGTIGTTSG